jgi:hypothetical protein
MHLTAVVSIPLVGAVTVDITLPLTASATPPTGGTGTVSFRHPPDAYGTPKSFGSNMVLPTLSAPLLSSLGINVSVKTVLGTTTTMSLNNPLLATLLAGLQGVVNTALSTANNAEIALDTNVISPLMSQLGVKLGGADVFALPRPSCSDPGLAG